MKKGQTNNAILSLELKIGFRGVLYEIKLGQIIKWLSVILVVGLRIYSKLHGRDP